MAFDDSILLHLSMGYTIIDITKTGNVSSVSSKERNQHRNWEALVQVLGLRAQIITMSSPELINLDITKSKFGSNFTGTHAVWTFKFGVEQAAVYANGDNLFGALENDFVNVPVILGLNETARIETPTFCVSGPNRNIYFEPITV